MHIISTTAIFFSDQDQHLSKLVTMSLLCAKMSAICSNLMFQTGKKFYRALFEKNAFLCDFWPFLGRNGPKLWPFLAKNKFDQKGAIVYCFCSSLELIEAIKWILNFFFPFLRNYAQQKFCIILRSRSYWRTRENHYQKHYFTKTS